jgi:acetyl coenzyme A synthetase (ADP forming)-like protein
MKATLEQETLRNYSASVTLRQGRTLHLRPIRSEDEDRLIAFINRLNWHTIYLRFHHVMTQMSREQAQALCTVDFENTFALVGIVGEEPDEKIIAVARYVRLPKGDSAEVAFTVEDSYHGQGIGTHMLEQLAFIARTQGIRTLEAEVLAENKDMMIVFQDSGFRVAEELEYGVYRVVLDIEPTEAYEEKSAERQRIATVASLRAFVEPKSIAVIGASQKPGSIGNILFRNILQNGYNGVLYPVNPNAKVIASVRSYASILEIPEEVDLAVVVVPAKAVYKTVQECGRKGVKGVVVISAGFGEVSAEGKVKEKELAQLASRYGMRLVGPNCMGVINTNPNVSMNATFSRVFPPGGDIAFCTQSGALGLAILEYAKGLNIGLSSFASIGNRADVDTTDLLQYWEQDENSNVILLYVESFGSPRRFARTARQLSAKKPVVVVKSGRTSAGAKAAASHTGAMASTDVASSALFKQAGMIRVDTLDELFDVAGVLSHQPIPRGRRVAILTNGGGPGIMTADACASAGLELPNLSDEAVAELKSFLSPQASVGNPVDMTADGGAEVYDKALAVLAREENIDIVIVIFVPPIVTEPEAVAAVVRKHAPEFRRRGKTLVSSFMSARGASLDLGSQEEGFVPTFTFPESTAMALRRACEYNEWRQKPTGVVPDLPGIDRAKARGIINTALGNTADRPLWLDAQSIEQLMAAYGIQGVPSGVAYTPQEAAKVAKDLGMPVVVKLMSDTIAHKTDVGGVVLDLRTEQDVERAFTQIKERLAKIGRDHEMQGVVIQKMITKGVETIVGVSQDPAFGPLILFGMGGITAELFKDVVLRIHPLTDVDAKEMVRSVKTYKLLSGWRGAKPADIEALEDLLLRISAMVEDLPEITELDLNPVKVQDVGEGYYFVDARVLINDASSTL